MGSSKVMNSCLYYILYLVSIICCIQSYVQALEGQKLNDYDKINLENEKLENLSKPVSMEMKKYLK